MGVEELLENPEEFRIRNNYRATNTVFLARQGHTVYVVKKPRRVLGDIINAYYVLQEKGFLGTRRIASSERRLGAEAEKLKKLEGLRVPRLIDYQKGVLVKEYLEGTEFRALKTDYEQVELLEGALQTLIEIHKRDICIGDAHVKNTMQCEKGSYWFDFDGVFETGSLEQGKAIDVLKFVYSTYTATRNPDAAEYAARLVRKNYPCNKARLAMNFLLLEEFNPAGLWLATRMPMNGKLNKSIKKVLIR